MTVFNLGSINADHFYHVPHLPKPGETLAAISHNIGLGGKGANQSVAAALAGAQVVHIGAVGPDGRWAVDRLAGFGVDTRHITTAETPTAHAIVNVDDLGENAIVIFSGANLEQSLTQVKAALNRAKSGDLLLLQNEASLQVESAELAKALGLYVAYSAAPFSPDAVEEILPFTDLLVLNNVEAGHLVQALGVGLPALQVKNILITHGADGATWRVQDSGQETRVPAFKVSPVDTAGAGDCFIGYVAAGLDQGLSVSGAMQLGAAAAALQVTQPGTADAIPTRAEVDTFLAERA